MSVQVGDRKYFAEIPAARETVLAPFRLWAQSGFAEGALDLLPSPHMTRPPVTSAKMLANVWSAALSGWNPDEMTEVDRAEAAARFEFTHHLLNELMMGEANIRDGYYAARRKGIVARTLALCGTVVFWVASTLWLPFWLTAPSLLATGFAIGACWKRLSRQVESAPRSFDTESLIASVLPWRAAQVPSRV
jgi:hypothetical protein